MIITQAAVNRAHREHRQETRQDIDGGTFTACSCGKMFDSPGDATMHWWRCVRAITRCTK